MLKTERLVIRPFDYAYLEEYNREFTDEIAEYQYPDSFPNLDAARKTVSAFVEEMERGNMLELVILTHGGEFLGSMEAFGLREKTPEIGLWLKHAAQGKGYAYEAMRALLDALKARGAYPYYLYEVDVRNAASIHLVEKFRCEKGGYEELTTESGKLLNCRPIMYMRKRKSPGDQNRPPGDF